MDFFQIVSKEGRGKDKPIEVYPDFIVGRSKDLMVRGQSFYAIWDEEKGLWSTDEFDVRRLVDEKVNEYADKLKADGVECTVKLLRSYETGRWDKFKKYVKNVADDYTQLDMQLTFANTEVKKSDYVSRRLPYDLAPGDHSAWDELVGTLYNPEEKAKIEWAIGAIVSGDSKKIQKFLVLHGPPGHGKGTIIDILLRLFPGYTTTFDAKALTGGNNGFAAEKFKSNPLVAIQHDGDLSKIEDNTKLNSIVSHEIMTINEKYKPGYDAKVYAFLFMGTNSPVKITDQKSGIIRRLIDVRPSGNTHEPDVYHALVARIDFELGSIAQHCLDVYREMGKNYYSSYRPLEMMYQTDVFFNFIEAHYDVFKEQDGVSLTQAYNLYKEFCSDSGIDKPLQKHKVREQLKSYFDEFHERIYLNGSNIRSYYSGFSADKFKAPVGKTKSNKFKLVLEETVSRFDTEFANQPAQGWKLDESDNKIPEKPWRSVRTTLADIETSELHYVQVPENHIVIDFDLKDKNGKKSLEKNLEAASAWPATYGELSQGGGGVHLHYTYDGDVSLLASVYSEGIEIKTLLGGASLRRRLSKCNDVPVATISSGLPFKEKKVLHSTTIQSEKGLRDLIERNLRKEIHPGTKPSIDFIHKILSDAYASGMKYDLTDLRPRILAFANNSSNQPLQSLKVAMTMKFSSEDSEPSVTVETPSPVSVKDERLVFFDIEVYPNLFVVCWKYSGDANIVKMINPSAQDVEALFSLKLVGFNNRQYDNHILYARYMGYDLEGLYKLSQKIIDGNRDAMFGAAYSISWADIYDFASKKQGLKKWQIDLGLPHKEMDLPWGEPVPEDRIMDVVSYCCNDVLSTEKTFEARQGDYTARLILSDLSGLSPNETTAKHTAKIIFGNDRAPQKSFVYTDLSKEFPGYVYDFGKASYRGEDPSRGGYVYAEPGIYEDVALLDVASMHPTSIIQLNMFGPYTPNFAALVDAQLALKKGDFESVKTLMNGKLKPYIEEIEAIEDSEKKQETAGNLRYALKIAINIVYGLTSADFENPFRDPRNKDNIVAKRGALFMIDLKHAVQEQGFTVAHIKTDSIKIPNATPEIIEFVKQFGEKYGYSFEHEATYDKFCLLNDAVYIAKETECLSKQWTAVGAQFQHPYVFKTLLDPGPTAEDQGIVFDDLCETKQVTGKSAIYIDFTGFERPEMPDGMHFVGKIGRFVPVREGFGGGVLYRVKDGKSYAVAGTKGYLWVEDVIAKELPEEAVDMSYFERLVDDARKKIEDFGDVEEFIK
jgi:hypothetical protein